MKKGKNAATIGVVIGLLLGPPLLKLISEKMGNNIKDMIMICLTIILGVVFIYLAIWVFKQKRYFTVITSLFLSIGFFTCAYGKLIDNGLIFIIGDVIFVVSGCAFYFSIIKFNKKHGINR